MSDQPFVQSLRQVAKPLAVLLAPLVLIGGFAADAYIKQVVRDEIELSTGSKAASQVQAHATRLTVVEKDVDDVEADVVTLDTRFHDFVQKIIDKL